MTIPGADRPNVHGYAEVISGAVEVGDRVAVIGAGGIGFDVGEFLTHAGGDGPQPLAEWQAEWGVGDPAAVRGGLVPPRPATPPRQVYLLQRKTSRIGAGLGKTTGWVHRTTLARRGVEMIRGVAYERIDDEGLHLVVDGRPRLLEIDDVVVCAGQEPRRELADELAARGRPVRVVGGADLAVELDAKRAIDQGTRLAAAL